MYSSRARERPLMPRLGLVLDGAGGTRGVLGVPDSRLCRGWGCELGGAVLAPGLLALPPFEGFGLVDPFDDGGVQAGEDVADFGGAGAEELAAHVDQGPRSAVTAVW